MSKQPITAKYDAGGRHFEILVDAETAYKFKAGELKEGEIAKVLISDEIFKDAEKGERQTEENLKKAFGTLEAGEIAKRIILEGDLPITTDHRRKLTEERRRQVIEFISRECIDPKTKTPHPPLRIEQCFEQMKIHVDPFKPVDAQANAAIEKISELIPISRENLKVAIMIPASCASKGFTVAKEFNPTNEQWQPDGSFIAVCDIPAGRKDDLVNRLKSLSHGTAQIKVL